MYARHMGTCCTRRPERASSCELLCGSWERNLGFLQGQPVLLPAELPPAPNPAVLSCLSPISWCPFPSPELLSPEPFLLLLPSQIQQQWLLYTIRLDHMMEDALRMNVKWSLLELSKAINGDGKTTPNPLFRVLVILQDDIPGGVAQVRATGPPAPQDYHTLVLIFFQVFFKH